MAASLSVVDASAGGEEPEVHARQSPPPLPRSARSSPSPGRQSSPARDPESRPKSNAGSPKLHASTRPATPPPSAKVGKALGAILTLAGATGGAAMTVTAPLQQTVMASPPARRFEREVYAPISSDFIFPYFEHFSLYDHHGSFREAWPHPACSAADRPTDVEPSEGNYHFVMDVHEFLAVYPFPIGIQTSSVVCTYTTFAQNHRWREFALDGSMLRTAEEFLLMLYIGSRAASETSPGALRHIIGPPSFTASTFDHGDPADVDVVREKNFDVYVRNLDRVAPSHVVPVALQRPRASHPNPEVQMILRSSFPPAFAQAHVSVWNVPPHEAPEAGRPAPVVASGYAGHRALMLCRYWAFASRFAVRLTSEMAVDMQRPRMLIAVPMGFTGAAIAALVPRGGGCFAAPYEEGVPLLQQMQAFSAFLPCDVPPQEMSQTRDARADIVFAMPCVFQIAETVQSPAGWTNTITGADAAWCTIDALVGSQLLHAALAFERCKSFVQAVTWLHGRIGIYEGPKPVLANRAGEVFRSAARDSEASQEWADFLELEKGRRDLFVIAFTAADGGSGLLAPFLENIITAYDLAEHLVPPPQGLPAVHADTLLLLAYPEPPAPLHTEYLARMPPQAVPDGFPAALAYADVVRRWGRRVIANALNLTVAHDAECYREGWSEKPRHPFTCLGPGCFKHFHFLDGGKILLNQFILVNDGAGQLRPMDFAAEIKDHKSLEAVVGIMGFSSDKELLSFLLHGMRWKAPAPRHFRIGHNLFSLKSRARGVAEATAKLIDKGLFQSVRVCQVGVLLTEDSPCPLWCSPQYSMGMGGADKTDKPDEKRPTGNVSEPHRPTRERNSPHGEADGDWVVNFNDLTGPKQPKAGPPLPSGFPDREHKYRVREIYHANAYIRALAHVNNSCPGLSRDDVRWMFFQLYTETCEHWLQIQYLVIAVCAGCDRFEILCVCADKTGRAVVLWLHRIMPKVMNMGTRPSSKVAVRFSKEINVEWRERMADFVHSGWLDNQTQALRSLLADRESRLGYEQAHPFWCCEWTDDFWDLACEPTLCAHGALTRRLLAKQINLWMSSKASCGTTGDYIGARCCLTGGFGTVTIEKRGRCVGDSLAALSDLCTKDELHAHNSFIVHIVDVLNLDPAVTNGLWAPDMLPVPGFAIVPLSEEHCAEHMRKPFQIVRDRYAEIIALVSTRPAAAFLSGVRDVPDERSPTITEPTLFIRMGSDCRSDSRMMRVFGHALEYEWFLALDKLDGRWSERHINVGESIGAAVNVATFGLLFGSFQLIQEGDNTTEGAMLLGTSKVADQQYIRRRLAQTEGFQECKSNLWFEHSFGTGLGFDDAGSRERSDVLAGLAASFGRRRVTIDVLQQVPGVSLMLADILDNTSKYIQKPRSTARRTVHFAPSSSDLRAEREEERGEGTCASAFCTSASHVLSPTPPRRDVATDGAAQASNPRSPTPTRSSRSGVAYSPLPLRSDALVTQSVEVARALSPTPPRPESGAQAAADRATRSPQPLNAKAARAASTFEAADKLLDTSNPYLLGPRAPGVTRSLVLASKACAHEGIPRGTLDHDTWGFNWARRFCDEHDTPVMRPRVGSEWIDTGAEAELIALMLFWVAPRMQPAPRKREKGIGNAQPPSAMQALYGWRRVLRDCGRFLGDLHQAATLLKGMNQAFLKAWGQEALAVDHHVPFALEHIRACHEALRAYAIIAWSKVRHDAICVIVLFSLVRGPRLDEWCQMFAGDTFYRRQNFVWVRERELIGSTPRAVAAGGPKQGWLIRVQNVPSKTDRTGQRWLGRFMWFVLDFEAPLNFAAAWLRWELAYPCPEDMRASWPAFSPTGDSAPFTPGVARGALTTLLTFVIGAVLARLHAWHDFRATIASALKGAGVSDAKIQAVVCWASAASVAIYGQMTPELMASTAELALTVDASRHAHLPTPHIGSHSVSSEIEACANALLATPTPGAAPKPKNRPASKAAGPSSATAPAKPAAAKSKRRRPPSPAAASSSCSAVTALAINTRIAVHDLGEQYGEVEVDTSCAIAGQRTRVLNTAWGAGAGSTPCHIVGIVRGVPSARGMLYVVQSSDDGYSYPFSAEALRSHLSQAQRLLLGGKPKGAAAPAAAASKSRPRHAPIAVQPAEPATPVTVSVATAAVRRSPRLLLLESLGI